MEKKYIDIFIVVLILLLLAGLVYFTFVSKFEGGQCLEDPLGYSEKLAGEGFTCSCFGLGSDGKFMNYYAKGSSQSKIQG